MRISIVTIAALVATFDSSAFAQTLPVGQLEHDGPATPEQIAMVVPVTGELVNSATANVRYRPTSSAQWSEAHPLFRVRPEFSTTPAVGSVRDHFAWTIIDLEPGRSYDVEVTISDSGSSVVRNATYTTRSLPPAAGPANKTISAGSSSAEIQNVVSGLQPGDVLEFENGQYSVGKIELTGSGTQSAPIYIRGESRDNVVLNSTAREILRIRTAGHLIIENFTISGQGSDGAIGNLQTAIMGGGGGTGSARNTIRNLTITDVDKGISFWDEISEALVYNNTLAGNNVWNSAYHSDNRTWDDDGILLPGYGNVAFNNSLSGFGDTMSFAQHAGNGTLTETRGVHYYRNDIRNSIDDVIEVDHAHGNVSFYDNRAHNVATCTSLDPLYGGPFLYARNVCINPARVNLHKWNDINTGQFVYNNTFIIGRTAAGGDPDVSSWYQPNNGAQEAYGFRNNIIVYRGNGNMLWLESGGHTVVDWTHNSWYPSRDMQWDFTLFNDLADAQNNLRSTTPIFSGSTRRMQNDNITVSNPWTTQINLGANAMTEVVESYTPQLATGTTPKNSGVIIPNITDGYIGTAPDRGGLIGGRPLPAWGDQNSAPPPSPVRPEPPQDLTAE